MSSKNRLNVHLEDKKSPAKKKRERETRPCEESGVTLPRARGGEDHGATVKESKKDSGRMRIRRR